MIRPASPADCSAIHDLILELAAYEKLTHQVVATADSLQDALFGESPGAEALVAETDGTIVAYAIFFHNYSTFAGSKGIHLEDLYVQPHARGRGIGKAMLEHLIDIAKSRDCARCEWTVLDWNRSAIEFYERMGAAILDDWRVARLELS